MAFSLGLERRSERSTAMAVVSPLLAVALTLASAAMIFFLLGQPVGQAMSVYFVEPVQDWHGVGELIVKATPLVLIATGLAVCYLSNNWNIGAEGQYVAGATLGGGVALLFQGSDSALALPAMILAAMIGGALYALIPAVLKARFNTNEILTSLMLVYTAQLMLDWLVRGPWRDPQGFNFPQTVSFDTVMPPLMPFITGPLGGLVSQDRLDTLNDSRAHIGALFAVLAVIGTTLLLGRSLKGFEIRVSGQAPRAALFAGFSPARTTLFVFALSGALAGLAGIGEVAGSMGQLQPSISPGYGFTAIIVAFLGRLNPVGILIAGLALALSYLGGESAQVALRVPIDITRVIQGLLLFYVLACDTLILYRVRLWQAEAARPVVQASRAGVASGGAA